MNLKGIMLSEKETVILCDSIYIKLSKWQNDGDGEQMVVCARVLRAESGGWGHEGAAL